MTTAESSMPVGGNGAIAILWAILLTVVVGVMLRHQTDVFGVEERPLRRGPSFAQETTGRCLLGGQSGLGEQGSAFESGCAELRGLATGPGDVLYEIALVAELVGAEEALARLDEVQASEELPEVAARHAETLRGLYGGQELSPLARASLKEDLGWFGELAAVFGQPASDPERDALVSGATRTFVALMGAIILIGILGLGGLALLVVAASRFGEGRFRSGFRIGVSISGRECTRPYLEAFLLMLLAVIGVGALAAQLEPHLGGGVKFLIWVVPFLGAWPLFRGVEATSFRHDIGLHCGRGVGAEIVAGLAGWIAALPALGLVLLLISLLGDLNQPDAAHPIVEELSDAGPGGILGAFAMASLWAPITEEVMFRGLLFRHLRSRLAGVVAALLSAVIFAVIHPQHWVAMPLLATLGVAFALLREWRGSLIAPMVAHGVSNAVVLSVAVFMS